MGKISWGDITGVIDRQLDLSSRLKRYQQKIKFDDVFYLIGDENTDNSYRMKIDGVDLLIQRRISGVWTTKQTITG